MLTNWSLTERASGRVVTGQLELAAGYWSRLRGLQFRAPLPVDRGLLLVPCGSIHTFFMRFAIDVVFLDSTGQVVGVRQRVRPWRVVPALRGTHAVLELPAGTASLTAGDSISLTPQASEPLASPPKPLKFLPLGSA